jgi:hypothetical protein
MAGMPSRRTTVVALVALLVVVAAAVTVGVVRHERQGAGQATSTGSSSDGSVPSPTVAPTTAAPRSPLTGRPAATGRPVLAVKIDNVRPARPQTGLDQADVVYVEPVEGGLSRIMAIFSASVPAKVGPVRSARESDLELLAQYGRPGLAFSGANRSVLASIKTASVADLSQDRQPSAYGRSSTRAAPHNLFADPQTLLKAAKNVSAAKDIGFQFGALPAGLGTPSTHKVIRYGAARTEFTWSAKSRRWNVTLDGTPATTSAGARLAASTVIVQYTRITASGLHDVLGNTTPYTHSVGSGKAVVLRDGVAISARWSRPLATGGTTFTTAAGAAVPFATGQVWVIFAAS